MGVKVKLPPSVSQLLGLLEIHFRWLSNVLRVKLLNGVIGNIARWYQKPENEDGGSQNVSTRNSVCAQQTVEVPTAKPMI